MNENISPLQKRRLEYRPPLPSIFQSVHRLAFVRGEPTAALADQPEIQKHFPKTYGQPLLTAMDGPVRIPQPMRVGVVFSGGQAAGGHNVIGGLLDTLHSLHPENKLLGFLGGPSGIIEGKHIEITEEVIGSYRNMGGFDMLGSGRTKIETQEQLQASLATMKKLDLRGLVVIGGDDSNTNAAVMAEFFLDNDADIRVIGVPKTIDGDLKNEHIAVSFGFDTACKVYSEMIGNICRDAFSAGKYYHFIKLMGRSASHITLECAMNTHPNYVFLSEEVEERNVRLSEITRTLADLVANRAKEGKNHGVILIPEGLIEFIPEMKVLINELNSMEATNEKEVVKAKLGKAALAAYDALPREIQHQLLLDRDPHGNVRVSQIETEALLMEMVAIELKARAAKGEYSGKFRPLKHFFGYEGRSGFPSNFDSNYCYALGATAAMLVDEGVTGYMACVKALTHSSPDWKIGGVPITMLMNMEKRKGEMKPVIRKALVDLKGAPFKRFEKERDNWILNDEYRYPGSMQYFGEEEIVDAVPISLQLETEE